MTKLMEEAIRKIAGLPDGQQDAVASIVLAEIEAEDIWENEFAEGLEALEELSLRAFDSDVTAEVAFLEIGER